MPQMVEPDLKLAQPPKIENSEAALNVLNGLDPVPAQEFSPLGIFFLKNCIRGQASHYRKVMQFTGFQHHQCRDISFVTDDIMQVITYKDAVPKLLACLQKAKPEIHLLVDFDPMNPLSFGLNCPFTSAQLKNRYFENLKKALKRINDLLVTNPSYKRTAAFVEKVISTENIGYNTPTRASRQFLMGSFININLEKIVAQSSEAPKVPVDVNTPVNTMANDGSEKVADTSANSVAAKSEATDSTWGTMDIDLTDIDDCYVDCPSLGSPVATDSAPKTPNEI